MRKDLFESSIYGRVAPQRVQVKDLSPQLLRKLTRGPTTNLINLRHYNLTLDEWDIFRESDVENETDVKKKKPVDFSKLIAFNKSSFLRNTKELDLGISWPS